MASIPSGPRFSLSRLLPFLRDIRRGALLGGQHRQVGCSSSIFGEKGMSLRGVRLLGTAGQRKDVADRLVALSLKVIFEATDTKFSLLESNLTPTSPTFKLSSSHHHLPRNPTFLLLQPRVHPRTDYSPPLNPPSPLQIIPSPSRALALALFPSPSLPSSSELLALLSPPRRTERISSSSSTLKPGSSRDLNPRTAKSSRG